MTSNSIITVELRGVQFRHALSIGKARYEANERMRASSKRIARGLSDLAIHNIGALAEVAVSFVEHRDIRVEVANDRRALRNASGPDVGQWQVKGTTMRPPQLMIPWHRENQKKDKFYLLVFVDMREEFALCTILGWIPGEWLFCDENIVPINGYDWYVAQSLMEYQPGIDAGQTMQLIKTMGGGS